MANGINSIWFKDLKDLEREKMREFILSNKIMLDKLVKICYNIGKDREIVTPGDYDSPSWSHKQAHNNGFQEALRKLIEICEIKER